jgi:hypothetical protein
MGLNALPVTFFHPHADALAGLRQSDYERDWRDLLTRYQAMPAVVRTYCHLVEQGLPVSMSAEAPRAGVAVVHADDLPVLLSQLGGGGLPVIVSARGDRPPQYRADFEVVQNPGAATPRRCFFIPVWPQPGLIPRDPGRGATIARIAFKGFRRELNEDFRSPAWTDFLRRRDIAWAVDEAVPVKRQTDFTNLAWHDFSQTDLILAVRREVGDTHLRKPPTKLVNAWAAGVPAILGPESAYRAVRKTALDYLEVSSLAEACRAVDELRADPARYLAMVENGRERACEFSAARVGGDWQELLFSTIPGLLRRPIRSLAVQLPRAVKYRINRGLRYRWW